MDISLSIIVGVISGIVTSFFIWILIKVLENFAIPWYQSIVYRGIKIDGEWNGFYKDLLSEKLVSKGKTKPHSRISLRQKGHKVVGEQIINVQPRGTNDQKQMRLVNGLFRDNNLLISFDVKDKTRFGMGNYLMKLVEDGQKFEGKSTYVGSLSGGLFTEDEFWVRRRDS